ncbi:hypothetical protein, partial [Alistipes sp.]|uniref:hypothetical protein n=1 Tax=Alistipes sp. TaxID=1872444 RepID=UPI003AAF7AC2
MAVSWPSSSSRVLMAVSLSPVPEVLFSAYIVSGNFSRLHDVVATPSERPAAIKNIFFIIGSFF